MNKLINSNLESAITGSTEKIFNISNNIDCGSNLYSVIEKKYKKEILTSIKTDLLDKYKDISIIELELLSNNIYDFCCLAERNISEKDILTYLSNKNRYYYNMLSEEDLKKLTLEVDINTLKMLSQKYTNILRNKK